MQKILIAIIGTYLNTINLISSKIGGRHAFLMFCYPFAVKLNPKQKEFLNTSTKSYALFNNKKIATYQWGAGPTTILLLHGWRSNTFRWKKHIESLDLNKYTILSIDAPGHGLSEGVILNVPLYAELIEQLLAEHDVDYILAHSLGAFSCMCLFYEKPELSPKKMALLGTPGEATEFMTEYARILKTHPRVSNNITAYFQSYANKKPSYYSTVKFATGLHSNALLIHDTEDNDAPYHHAQKINENWKEAELYSTKGLGHTLRGSEVVNKVTAYFDK